MKRVTLYQVIETDQIVSGDHLELSNYSRDQISHIRLSDEFIIENTFNEIISLPVQKFIFNQKCWKTGEISENIVYAAFDDKLLELIQCERDKFETLQIDNERLSSLDKTNSKIINELNYKALKLEDRIVQLNKVVDTVNQVGFWKRLVYLFKGKLV